MEWFNLCLLAAIISCVFAVGLPPPGRPGETDMLLTNRDLGLKNLGDQLASTLKKIFEDKPENNASEKVCNMCKTIMQTLKNEAQKVSAEELIEIVKNICIVFPEIQSQCTSAVDEYGQLIYTIITQSSAESLCQLLKLCEVKSTLGNKNVFFPDFRSRN